jgi:hypothetical protein
MSITITLAEAVERARAAGGRIVYEEPTGERTEVAVPEPPDDGDYGPPYLDPPFPAPALSGKPVPTKLGDPLPFTPIVVTADDLSPE